MSHGGRTFRLRIRSGQPARDLRSLFRQREYGFKSHPGHHMSTLQPFLQREPAPHVQTQSPSTGRSQTDKVAVFLHPAAK